jgi:integrase
VIFAVFTMMRIGEIVNLRWSDIDLERKEFHIHSNEKFHVKRGKPRTVPMNRWVYTFLRGCSVRREYVFQSRNG